VFEKLGMTRIFDPKRKKITGDWRKLLNENLRDFLLITYCSDDQIEEGQLSRACGTYGREGRIMQGLSGEV
jgi:hypothetical protein